MEQIIKSKMRGMVETIARHVEMRQKLHSQFRVALCDIEVYITSRAYVYIPTSMSVMCNFPKHRELQFNFLQNRMHDFALSVETFDLKVMRAEIEDALVKPICAVTANQLDSINQRQKFYPNDPQNITWEDIFNEKVVILPNENHYTSTERGI